MSHGVFILINDGCWFVGSLQAMLLHETEIWLMSTSMIMISFLARLVSRFDSCLCIYLRGCSLVSFSGYTLRDDHKSILTPKSCLPFDS